MPPRALIAEDEPLLAAALRAQLAEAWPGLEFMAPAPNGLEALRLARDTPPDVAFLDIRMPGLGGLEVAAELLDQADPAHPPPHIVFVTAYDEYALKAFELAAVDYLLKPVAPERLAQALGGAAGAASPASAPVSVIRASVGDTVRMIPVDEVLFFQAADKYTRVVTAQGEALIRTPLKELLEQLPRPRFQQVHRGTLVNMDAVASATRDESGRVSLKLRSHPESLAVSRVYAELFRPM